jgi:uncharacterized membrane protein YeiH
LGLALFTIMGAQITGRKGVGDIVLVLMGTVTRVAGD